MKIILLILFLLISNCKLNKVVDNHGVLFLEKKQQKKNFELKLKDLIQRKVMILIFKITQ